MSGEAYAEFLFGKDCQKTKNMMINLFCKGNFSLLYEYAILCARQQTPESLVESASSWMLAAERNDVRAITYLNRLNKHILNNKIARDTRLHLLQTCMTVK